MNTVPEGPLSQPTSHAENAARPALCIEGRCNLALWGRTPAERLKRQFTQAGAGPVLSPAEASRHHGLVVVVRADAVLDPPLIRCLLDSPDLLLVGQGPRGDVPVAATVAGRDVEAAARVLAGDDPAAAPLKLSARRPQDLGAQFWKGLRKRETPYALIVAPENRSAVEWRMFMGT